MAPQQSDFEDKHILPSWFDNVTLGEAIRKHVGEYKNILEIKTENVNKENGDYSTVMTRIKAVVEKEDGSNKAALFVLKAPQGDEVLVKILDMLRLYSKEEQMYQKLLPKFKKLYEDVGKSIQFAPKSYIFDRDIGLDYVLLEDLNAKGYKNANRLEGLDVCHLKKVLIKLAEFHAASACYVEHYGMFNEEFTVGIFNRKNKALLKEFNNSEAFLNQLKKWKNCEQFYAKLADSDEYLVERLLESQRIKSSEFNVLNHGDCWTNNIMFKYDAFDNIKDVLFVDFQVSKYGSPANDLYYLILSSANNDVKLKHFDYLIRFYYEHLVENLKLLQYHRPLPKLKNIHISLMRNGLTAYLVVSKVLPVVMLENMKQNNSEHFKQDEGKIKEAMFSNYKYMQVMSNILPWLDNRGLLDWK